MTAIGAGAFQGCTALTSLIVPEGVTSIGDYVFFDCSALASVVLPTTLQTIGESVFGYPYHGVLFVYYAGSQDDWDSVDIGAGNEGLTKAVFHFDVPVPAPLKVTTLGASARAAVPEAGIKAGLRFGSRLYNPDKIFAQDGKIYTVTEFGTLILPQAVLKAFGKDELLLSYGDGVLDGLVLAVPCTRYWDVTDSYIEFVATLVDGEGFALANYPNAPYVVRAYVIGIDEFDNIAVCYADPISRTYAQIING